MSRFQLLSYHRRLHQKQELLVLSQMSFTHFFAAGVPLITLCFTAISCLHTFAGQITLLLSPISDIPRIVSHHVFQVNMAASFEAHKLFP